MTRPRRFLSLLYALAVPWAWCGLAVAVATAAFAPAVSSRPFGVWGTIGYRAMVPIEGAGPWRGRTTCEWVAGPWPHPRHLVLNVNRYRAADFLSHTDPPPEEYGSEAWGLYYIKHRGRADRSVTVRVGLWWLLGVPTVFSGLNAWRWARRSGAG